MLFYSCLGAEYSYAAQGGGCEVDAETGALTVVAASGDPGISTDPHCSVTLTAMKSGYESQTAENTVVIAKKPQADLTVEDPYGMTTALKKWGEC